MQGELRNLCMKSVFITGSNRGIGFEFVKQLTRLQNPPKHIFAACRNPSAAKELQELASQTKTIHVIQLDVEDHGILKDVVEKVKSTVTDTGLNLLINNAGFLDRKTLTLSTVTPEAMRKHFEVNTIGPMMISKAFIPLLKTAAKTYGGSQLSYSRAGVMNVTSNLGSMTLTKSGSMVYAYGSSKCASHIITKSLATDLKNKGIITGLLHPGWVKTEMGTDRATIDTETSVLGMLKVMAAFNESNTGSLYDYKGNEVPW